MWTAKGENFLYDPLPKFVGRSLSLKILPAGETLVLLYATRCADGCAAQTAYCRSRDTC